MISPKVYECPEPTLEETVQHNATLVEHIIQGEVQEQDQDFIHANSVPTLEQDE